MEIKLLFPYQTVNLLKLHNLSWENIRRTTNAYVPTQTCSYTNYSYLSIYTFSPNLTVLFANVIRLLFLNHSVSKSANMEATWELWLIKHFWSPNIINPMFALFRQLRFLTVKYIHFLHIADPNIPYWAYNYTLRRSSQSCWSSSMCFPHINAFYQRYNLILSDMCLFPVTQRGKWRGGFGFLQISPLIIAEIVKDRAIKYVQNDLKYECYIKQTNISIVWKRRDHVNHYIIHGETKSHTVLHINFVRSERNEQSVWKNKRISVI